MDARLRTIVDAERRIELIQGRVQVGGHRATTRLVLEQLLAQASLAELRELGGDGWHGAAQLARDIPAAPLGNFNHPRHYSLLQRLSLPLFDVLRGSGLATYNRDLAVWLGDSALTPDAFVGFDAAMREYYLEGPPLLAVEVIDPYNPTEELERLGLYGERGTPEVWWLEPESECVRQFILQDGHYTVRTQREGWLGSAAVAGLAVHLEGAWHPGWEPPLKVAYQGKLSRLSEPLDSSPQLPLEGGLTEAMREELLRGVLDVLAQLREEPDRGGFRADLPFAPRVTLAPQRVSFEAFISWTTEAKFEVVEGRLVIGSERGNHELLGLLLMTFGLVEAFSCLPDEMKGVLRGVN